MKEAGRVSIIAILIVSLVFGVWFYSGWPQIWHNPAFPPTVQKAQAAAPTFVVCGAQASGTAGITPAPGTGRTVNDIDLLFIETANEAITLTTPAGFAEMTFVGTGTAADAAATRMTVFWRRWDGVAGNPTVGDSGNHQIAVICSFSGVITSGNPWNIFGTNTQEAATTAGSISAISTTVPNTLIVAVNAGATPDANSTAEYSGWANVNLTGLTEQFDVTRNAGNGGAIGIATGVLAPAGSTGITTFTTAASSVKANMHIALSPAPTFGQQAYRLFHNLNSTDVEAALAPQDTTATLGSAGAAFRLRMLIRVDTATLAISGQSFHLQFATRSGVCDTGFVGETYAGVTAATEIAFNDNPAPADGAALTANALDPVDGARVISNQTYEELNPFTNAVSAITAGQTGKWDFSLRDNGAPAGTSYCFRVVLATGVVIHTYTIIPEITTFTPPPTFEQSNYRLFDNLNSTDVGPPLAEQNAAATLGSAGAAFRLRQLIRVGASPLILEANGHSFHLQFSPRSGTCDTGFVGETYADVTAATAIAFNDNPAPVDGAALTSNANDPVLTGSVTRNQTYEELNPFTPSQLAIAVGESGMWDFALRDNGAPAGTSYCFRIVLATGAVINTYTIIPEITTFTAVAQTLTFSLGANSLALGTLAAGGTAASSHTVAVATNAANGVVITYSGATLTSGAFTITAMSANAASAIDTEQFGLNAMANTTPAIGAACTGTSPIASAAANYNTANSFRFVSGETIVSSAGAINSTTCTISYIANIAGATEAGSYNTTLTYTATAQF